MGTFLGAEQAPEGLWYSVKRRLLGPPLVNADLGEQRLTKPLALGVLSPDGISSSAYGPEEILIGLLPIFGLAAFTMLLPVTGVVLFVLVLVVLSYREVVSVYVRPGGSYVVARDNFGPRVAQVAAVALLVDYVVTVAVQTSAGTAAVVSAVPALGPYSLEITVGVVLLMLFGNLRGLREAGRSFAVPTYLFSAAVLLMIAIGLVREILGNLPNENPHQLAHHYPIGASTAGLTMFVLVFTILKSFANGGSSLTGIEAVSDAVGAFRPPESANARKVLVSMGLILGALVAGISWLAHLTHATPRTTGYPTMLAQEAQIVGGHSAAGQVLFISVQAASALILYTGANTSFNGFPFLASFVAGDAFLPRWLLKRGHRLVFSNGIIVLTACALALMIVVGTNVNRLVPFYAIGVFTAFSLAGFGMARYHHNRREPGWRRKLIINASAGAMSSVVVLVFAVVKFTEGAWLVVVLFAVGVPALIRLNREYQMESQVLERIGVRPRPAEPPKYPRRTVYLLVDSFDLATIAALRYARSLRPTMLRAVHFVIDTAQAETLRQEWARADRGVVLDFVDCPDRRLTRAAAELVAAEAAQPGTQVTVVLPRRVYSPLLGRLLHDRTADKIASAVSQIPHSAATIVPFDVRSRLEVLHERQTAPGKEPGEPAMEPAATVAAGDGAARVARKLAADGDQAAYKRPKPSRGVSPIGSVVPPGRATVEGRVRTVEIRPVERSAVLATEISDSTGQLTAMFYGRTHIPGLICGAKVRFRGPVGEQDGQPVMINPAYELLAPGDSQSGGEGSG
jgi:amino acid transporter